MASRVKLIAQYFPQLHPIPENDRWWGEGFTDWVNVKRARPQFDGHYQPRVPAGGDYYDQSRPEVIRRQVELARAHGLSAFCHYHYWFDGKRLLETPTETFLQHRDLDFEFCLAWANETWSRRWDGQDHHILIEQTHPPTVESWGRHFDVLIRSWLDPRALRVDGKPVFLIYRPTRIPSLEWMMDYWQTRAHREFGLDGIYFVNIVQYHFPPWETLRLFDATMLFQPFVATGRLSRAPGPPVARWRELGGRVIDRMPRPLRHRHQQWKDLRARPTVHDYDAIWREILAQPFEKHLPTFHGAFVDWDNTARYRNRATVFHGATPERFEHYLGKLVDKVAAGPADPRLIFINAWNEWAEGAYLEPDEKYGMAYLEGVRRVMQSAAARPVEPRVAAASG